MSKPSDVLFISPVIPCQRGNGRAMRAFAWVNHLAQQSNVHVLVVRSPADSVTPVESTLPLGLEAASVEIIDAPKLASGRWWRVLCRLAPFLVSGFPRGIYYWIACTPPLKQIIREYARVYRIERIVCFRIYMHEIAMYAQSVCNAAAAEIDLDDVEWSSLLSIARVCFRRGRLVSGLLYLSQACQYWFLARATLGHYERIYLAAPSDAARLSANAAGVQMVVFPNQVSGTPAPPDLFPAPPFGLLFVGSLDYWPNEDAVEFLLEEVVPRLRQAMPCRFFLTLAGRRPSRKLIAKCRGLTDICLVGDPPEVASLYHQAHAALVPLRAGGGTKIKTLEAFLQGRAVVSTTEGVRGLAAVPHEHYVPAETADQFAEACAALAADRPRASRIAYAGQALVLRAHHIPERMED